MTLNKTKFYHGNPSIKADGYKHEFTNEEISELVRCSSDFIYFCVKYIKISDQSKGTLIPFELYEYQKRLFETYNNNDRVIVLAPRQSGKSVFTIAYLLWYATFNELKNIVLVANKEKTAMKTLKKLKEMYLNLPFFMKQGVIEWNKLSLSFENGCNIYAEATSSSGNRGDTVSILYIDECAIIEPNLWEDFYASVYPTISSVKNAKIIISSTPKGFNFYYNLWTMAINKQSDYIPFRVYWNEIPNRDETYRTKTIASLGGGSKGLRKWMQEYECSFIGSGGTLIEGQYLEKLLPKEIIESRMDNSFLIYEYPSEEDNYILVADVAEGTGNDYSTCQIFKILDKNHLEQVAIYRNNTIKTNEFDLVIDMIGKFYNDSLAIVEANTFGREILNRLVYDDEYPNVYYSPDNDDYGIKMTKQTKAIGNSYLKFNIEDSHFIIHDMETITELSKYIKKGDSYQADSGQHDDLVTPLVHLSFFLSNQRNIEDWLSTDYSISTAYRDRIEEELLPIGFISDGSESISMQDIAENKYLDE